MSLNRTRAEQPAFEVAASAVLIGQAHLGAGALLAEEWCCAPGVGAQNVGMLSRIRREIDIEGPLTDQDRRRLVEIADRCPVHRTLRSEVAFEYPEA
jgi:hypothetical protein